MLHSQFRTEWKYRLFLLAVILVTTMYYAKTFFQGGKRVHRYNSASSGNSTLMAEKWIVVTTINMPTQDVRKLANQIGWKMVVVGDKKTPQQWSLPNVVFLDVTTQSSLGYRILKYLPFGKYTRKAVGYLFAIQHGARCIYETDDDNAPTNGLAGFQCDDVDGINLMVSSSNITENPYALFGQSTIWPRGYPLDRVGLPIVYKYRVCNKATPTILQGVVNGDPDVDAVFRLTRRQPPMAFTLTFDSAAPPLILPPGTFAPFNSQNTFFLFRSLWAMILPISVTDRATDIYRSYWAQRLLWLIGDTLAFLPPNAVQVRNLHSLLKDAREEYELYQQMPRFVTVLNEWKCEKPDGTLFNCIKQLSLHLVKERFWEDNDAALVEAWLDDLNSVGYASPLLVKKPLASYCEPDKDTPGLIRFHPTEQTTSMPHTSELHVPAGSTNHHLVYNAVGTMCSSSHQLKWNKAMLKAKKDVTNVLLVVGILNDVQSKVPLLVAIYQLHFVNVIYCLTDKLDHPSVVTSEFIDKWRISVVWTSNKVDAVACLNSASKINYGVKGFLYLTEKMIVNNSISLLFDRVESPLWLYDNYSTSGEQTKQQRERGTSPGDDALDKLSSSQRLDSQEKKTLTSCVTQIGRRIEADSEPGVQQTSLGSAMSLLYLPQKLMNRFRQLREILTSELDHILPLLLQCEQSSEYAAQRDSAYQLLRSSFKFSKQLCSNIERTSSLHLELT